MLNYSNVDTTSSRRKIKWTVDVKKEYGFGSAYQVDVSSYDGLC